MQDERDDLADVPPEEFVAARDALAKKLKSEGKSDEAAAVKKLRKPTVTRWVADHVLRHHAREIVGLDEAGRPAGVLLLDQLSELLGGEVVAQ